MKKALCIILAAALVLVCLTACGGSPAATGSKGSPSATVSNGGSTADESKATSAGALSIGAVWYSKDDSLGSSVYRLLNQAAEALNVNLQWAIGNTSDEKQIADVENLISAGVKGIIIMPVSDIVVQKIDKICQEKKVYYSLMFRDISDKSIKAQAEANPYFAGAVFEDEEAAGKQLVKLLADSGVTKLGAVFLPSGSAMYDARNAGFRSGIKESKLPLLGETTLNYANLDESVQSVNSLLTSYSDMDGLILCGTAAGVGEGILNTLSSNNSKIKVATFDVFEGMDKAFEEGRWAVTAAGQYPDSLFAFEVLVNKMSGAPLSDKPVYLTQNYLFIKSIDDVKVYNDVVDNPDYQIYSNKDIQSMASTFNKDITLDDIKKIMSDYTLENIASKAK